MLLLTIDTENAAFEGDELRGELARILRAVAKRLDGLAASDLGYRHSVHDVNGNAVGFWEVKP